MGERKGGGYRSTYWLQAEISSQTCFSCLVRLAGEGGLAKKKSGVFAFRKLGASCFSLCLRHSTRYKTLFD
jgi:hypothetical protein